jgi:vacuolar-type H+-ATPase subunit D/Vma8
MNTLQDLLDDIEKLRQNLHNLINENNINLSEPEIISASQTLDSAISKYNEIVNKVIEK